MNALRHSSPDPVKYTPKDPLKIFLAELSYFIVITIVAIWIVGGGSTGVGEQDLGCPSTTLSATPYIYMNYQKFCRIPSIYAVWTAVYFGFIVLGLIVSEVLYRRCEEELNVGWQKMHKIAAIVGFWMAIIVWFTGLEGRRASYEFLTTGNYFRGVLICFFASLTHFLVNTIQLRRNR